MSNKRFKKSLDSSYSESFKEESFYFTKPLSVTKQEVVPQNERGPCYESSLFKITKSDNWFKH